MIKEEANDNKLIHHFMGGEWQPIEEGYNRHSFASISKYFSTEVECVKFCEKQNKGREEGKKWLALPKPKGIRGFDLDYHENWVSLMLVVEKIESFHLMVDIEGNHCSIYSVGAEDDNYPWLQKFAVINSPEDAKTKIEATYKAIVEFIKWYNANALMSIQDKMRMDAADIKDRLSRGESVSKASMKFMESYLKVNSKKAPGAGKQWKSKKSGINR